MDFGSLEYIEFEMSPELANRTVVKRIGPREEAPRPISTNLQSHVFSTIFQEARALRTASDLADECGYGGIRWWSVVWDCRDGACFFMPHKSGKRYSDYIVEWDDWDASDRAVPIRVSRVVAIRMLDEGWELFKHAGNVPSISERLD